MERKLSALLIRRKSNFSNNLLYFYFYSQSMSLVPTFNEVNSSRSASPRRLIKQVALESSPPTVESGDFASKVADYEQKIKSKDQFRIQRDRTRKITAATDQDAIAHARRTESW